MVKVSPALSRKIFIDTCTGAELLELVLLGAELLELPEEVAGV